MLARIVVLLFAFTAGFAAAAHAENCDQFQTGATHPGPGPTYTGVSRMPAPGSGPAPVLQWACFFKNTTRVVSMSGILLDPKGKPAGFFQYSTDLNYTYYADQTAIKFSFQKLPPQMIAAMKKANWSLSYTITFERPGDAPSPVVAAIPGTAGCYNRVCATASARGRLHYFDMNSNFVQDTSALPGAQAPVALTCGTSAEVCAAIDATGQMWRGQIRPAQSWVKTRKVGSESQGPYTIGCDMSTNYCLIIARDGSMWKGNISGEGDFVSAGKLDW